MSAILTIADLDPALEEPGFWTQKRLMYLKAILKVCGNSQRITPKQLPRLASSLKETYAEFVDVPLSSDKKLTQEEKRLFNEILEKLQDAGWRCHFFTLKQKHPRPSVLPSDPKCLMALHLIQGFLKRFWKGEIPLDQNSLKAALVLHFAAHTGLAPAHLKEAINTWLLEGWNQRDTKIKLATYHEFYAFYSIPVPLGCLLLAPSIELKPQQEISAFNQLTVGLLETDHLDQQALGKLKTEEILYAASQLAVIQGLEPVIFSQLQAKNLPIPPDATDGLGFTKNSFDGAKWPALIRRELKEEEDHRYLEAVANHEAYITSGESYAEYHNNTRPLVVEPFIHIEVALPQADTLDTDDLALIGWHQEAKAVLRLIRHRLRSFLVDDSGHFENAKLTEHQVDSALKGAKDTLYQNLVEKAVESSSTHYEADRLMELIDELHQKFTAFDLALAWIEYSLKERRHTFSTCSQAISTLFLHGFLNFPASSNLKDWGDEDAEIFVTEYLLSRQKQELSNQTSLQIQQTFSRLLQFAKAELKLFEGISFPVSSSSEPLQRTWRYNPPRMKEFDLALQKINKKDRTQLQVAAIWVLAFYGGLRSGEITNLTLDRLVVSKDELVIYLPAFKTPSARRCVPLHLLAPPKAVQVVRDAWEYRQIDFDRHKRKTTLATRQPLSKIRFLSLDRSVTQSSSYKIVGLAREQLQKALGEKSDLHLLRHAFATHLFMRWYVARYPELIPELLDHKHWVYSSKGLKAFRSLLGANPNDPLPASHVTGMVHLIKLMGHKTTTTFFEVYVHSFESVAQHALKRIQAESEDFQLHSRLITGLLPDMASKDSRAKLQDKSLQAAVRHLAKKKGVEITPPP
ncbi:Phage integrase family protein [Marinospirillum celere]|uniref:Phage integrase family protein n=1 Tax=Marinospirillum celere TaxID=1122252 RepID=A0A1I1EJY0_9GAMM|nr:site-specific integrase [Marinospirillum celere]SFB87405.1 Phage integrase family protein [Marinospirillum celere]